MLSATVCYTSSKNKTAAVAGRHAAQPRGHLAKVNPLETSPPLTCCLYLSAWFAAAAQSDPSRINPEGVRSGSPAVPGVAGGGGLWCHSVPQFRTCTSPPIYYREITGALSLLLAANPALGEVAAG